jgi:hypothetical protein
MDASHLQRAASPLRADAHTSDCIRAAMTRYTASLVTPTLGTRLGLNPKRASLRGTNLYPDVAAACRAHRAHEHSTTGDDDR